MRTRKKHTLGFGTGIAPQINSMGLDFLLNNSISGLGTIFGGLGDESNPLDAMFSKMAFGGEVGVDPVKGFKKGVKPKSKLDTLITKGGNMVTTTDILNFKKNTGFDYTGHLDIYGDFVDTWGGKVPKTTVPNVVTPQSLSVQEAIDKNPKPYKYDSPDYTIPAKRLALGGTVGSSNVEVEDNEVAETPLGDIMQFQGNTHEEGGIDVNLPNGTKVFSDRISIDGKTMQERKLKREKNLKKFSKAFESAPTDIVAKNSHDRTKQALDMEEQHDLAIQEIANRSVQPKKFAFGGEIGDDDPWGDILKSIIPTIGSNNNSSIAQVPFLPGQLVNPDNGVVKQATPILPKIAGLSLGTPKAEEIATTTNASAMTEGDAVGMFGNTFSGLVPLLSTLGSSMTDTPNINAFDNFGKDALLANDNAKGQLAAIKTSQDQKLQLSRTAARARNRNSASSVNTLRALDAVTDLNGDLASNDIASSLAQQMMQLYGQQASLENQQDVYQMQGEQARDTADRQDKGNFDTNLGQSLADLGVSISKTGKDLNTTQANQDLIDIMADMSTNGITYVRDAKTGRLKQKKVK